MNMLSIDINCQQNDFSLSITKDLQLSGILGVLGHSGSGKTTLLKTIAGLKTQAIGKLTFNNIVLMNSELNTFIPCEQRQISLVFQEGRLFPHLNVLENLNFAHKRCQSPSLNLTEIIELTEISHLINKKVTEISGGEKQRVALARAILAEPKLLLLDEPLSALDQNSKTALIQLLKKVHSQLSIPMIYVSHNIDEIQQLADDLLVLKSGKVFHYGPVHQVIHQLNNSGLIPQQTSLCLPILSTDEQHGLHRLQVTDQQIILLPTENTNLSQDNKSVRCFIFASDISLAVQEPSQSSIINQLKAQILAITTDKHQTLVTLQCGKHNFFASISLFSLERLQLQQNQWVFMQFKAGAVRTLKGETRVNNG